MTPRSGRASPSPMVFVILCKRFGRIACRAWIPWTVTMPCGLRKKPTSLLPKGARPYRSENAGGAVDGINGPMFGYMSTTIGTAYATDDNLGCVLRVHREPCIDHETSAPKVQM